MWTPAVVERIAAHLPPNEVQCVLRLVNTHTADQLSNRCSVRLSLPVPHEIFAARWQAPGACRSLTREQREQLLCLTASSGDVANLEVALAAAGLVSGKNKQCYGANYDALKTAAAACQLDCCRLLAASLDLPLTEVARLILPAAAERGDLALCRWAWEVDPKLQRGTKALCSAARGGHRAVCEACLDLLPDLPNERSEAISRAALFAAEGGHTELLDWCLSLCPGPWCDPDCEGDPDYERNPTRLLVAAVAGCDAATLERLWAEHGEAGGLDPEDTRVLRAVVSSRTPDWAAKAEWALRQGAEAHSWNYKDSASLPDAVARFRWLRDHGVALDPSPRGEGALASVGPFGGWALEEDLSQPVRSWRVRVLWAPLRAVAAAGNLEAVELLLGQGMVAKPGLDDVAGVAGAAARGGHTAVLRALLLRGCSPSPSHVADAAACAGRIPILEWVRDALGADLSTLAGIRGSLHLAAASSGSVRVMAWLREQGCEPRRDAWEGAVCGGCEAALELLHEWRVPKPADGQLYVVAAMKGDLRTLQALRRLGFSFGPRSGSSALFRDAVRSSPLEALQWLVASGCPVDWDVAEQELAQEPDIGDPDLVDERVLPWILEQLQQSRRFQFQRASALGGGVWTAGGSGPRGAKRANRGRHLR